MINNQLEHQLIQLLDEVKDRLPESDTKNIKELIEHTEYILAYEFLCTQIYEYNLQISYPYYENLASLGLSMKVNSSMWLIMKELIPS